MKFHRALVDNFVGYSLLFLYLRPCRPHIFPRVDFPLSSSKCAYYENIYAIYGILPESVSLKGKIS